MLTPPSAMRPPAIKLLICSNVATIVDTADMCSAITIPTTPCCWIIVPTFTPKVIHRGHASIAGIGIATGRPPAGLGGLGTTRMGMRTGAIRDRPPPRPLRSRAQAQVRNSSGAGEVMMHPRARLRVAPRETGVGVHFDERGPGPLSKTAE